MKVDQLDDLFRNEFSDYEHDFDEDLVWKRLEEDLKKKKRRRFIFFFLTALLITGCSLVLFFNKNTLQKNNYSNYKSTVRENIAGHSKSDGKGNNNKEIDKSIVSNSTSTKEKINKKDLIQSNKNKSGEHKNLMSDKTSIRSSNAIIKKNNANIKINITIAY